MKDMKVSLTQNKQRAISEAHRCGKIPLGRWVPSVCVDGGLWHPSKQDRNSESDEREEAAEDEDNSCATSDIFEDWTNLCSFFPTSEMEGFFVALCELIEKLL